jgi:glycosyltransferase involved in cell wall biosynthesis
VSLPTAEAESSNEPVRVLHVTAVESSNYHLNSLAEELHPNRVMLQAVTLGGHGSFVEALRTRGVQAEALGPTTRLSLPWTAIRFAALTRQRRAQIIHGHLFEPALVAALASRLSRRPLVLTRHHSDAIYRLEGRVRRGAYLQAERFVNSSAKHIIAPARMVERILIEREGVPRERVSVIPYPQNPSRFSGLRSVVETRRELEVGAARMLVTVSRLHPEKGLPVLLRAMTLLPADLQLLIVGTGPERARLEAMALELGLVNRVRLLGWRDDALSILDAADVVVHPSFHEALPSAVIEAIALAKPTVATDVSGVRDILGDQEYGRVVPTGDEGALARAISETLASLESARVSATAGRKRLLEYTRPDRVAAAHLDRYRAVRERPFGAI